MPVNWNDKPFKEEIKNKCLRNMAKACLFLEGEIKKSFVLGTGRRYKKGKGIWHTASAPGNPPAVDIGRLRGSISANWTGSGMSRGKVESPAKSGDGVGQPANKAKEIIGVVGTNVVYARRLEYGFMKKDKLGRSYHQAPRPYLRPALEKNKAKLAQIIGSK